VSFLHAIEGVVLPATGKPLGERTYLVNIDHNQIGDRQGASDRCASETYRPLQQHDEIASR
jgi:hypothetical protein